MTDKVNIKKRRLISAIYGSYFPFDRFPWFDKFDSTVNPADLTADDALVVWGGEDISPSLYNKPVGKYTGAGDRPSRRDTIEWGLMQRAKELNIPIIGVCRGAQMLCALAGGHLLQHVNHHGGHHLVMTFDGFEVSTNSIHHQMMFPWGVKHEMLASIKKPLSTVRLEVDNQVEVPEEPEFVYFPEVRGFAIQWHPEAMNLNSHATQFIFQELSKRV